MGNDVVIRVEDLSKRYRLGLIGRTALHEDLSRWWARLRGQPDPTMRLDQLQRLEAKKAQTSELNDDAEHIWALRDINFEVKQGEVLGIIGKNGAGKSTLLKILSRVTAPTLGCVKVKGRIASLLEVGTGFHPELTGRENIFLNGAILGMTNVEVRGKFDEIVAFAELDNFIDTPVKRYSSGMYVRLAFAVAAHLEPEILVVDEVLAVGDASFQKKCLGKMKDVAGHGRTVLFVSHNMSSIEKLCTRGIVIRDGELAFGGTATEAVAAYSVHTEQLPSVQSWEDWADAPGDGIARLKSVRVVDENGQPFSVVDIRKPFTVEVEYWHIAPAGAPTAILHFKDSRGHTLFATNEFNATEWKDTHSTTGIFRARCHVPGNLLPEGVIALLVAVNTYNPSRIHALLDDAISFTVVDHGEGDSVRGPARGIWPGLMRPWLDWSSEIAGPVTSSVAQTDGVGTPQQGPQ